MEEHTELTKRLLRRAILAISTTLVLLMIFDGLPVALTCLSLFTYYVYSWNLRTFPYINLTGSVFVSSCVLVILNHYLWFRHFSNPKIPTIEERLAPDYKPPHIPSFSEVASFFGICIWLVPFCLFISLSANENTLPSNLNDLHRFEHKDDDLPKKRGINLVKIVVGLVREKVFQVARFFGKELDRESGRII